MTKLSIIISVRSDPVGALITVISALEELSTLNYKYEIIIVDNSDREQHFRALRKLINIEYIRDGIIKIYHQDHQCLFTARELGIRKSKGKYLLFVDSHCIFGRDSIANMVEFAESKTNLGFVYGPVCYSVNHEDDAFCDRGVDDFLGIRLGQCRYKRESFKVPFRGMPFLCEKSFFSKIKGYGTLSEHRLPWGGGDFILGFKSAMLGYDNWMVTNATVIHIGPFKNDCYLPPSYIRESGRGFPKRFGMIISAYIIGGEKLVKARIEQLNKRIGTDTLNERTIQLAVSMGEEERRWLWNESKKTYYEIVSEFKNTQHRCRSKVKKSPIPKSDGTTYDKKKPKQKPRHRGPTDDWRSRILAQTV